MGPTAVMRSEHREIERLLEAIAADVGAAESDDLVARIQAL